MLSDSELIGIPHRLVIGERGLKSGTVEYQGRRDAKAEPVALHDAVNLVRSKVCGE